MLATLLRPAPAFGGADANEVALYIGNAAKYGQRPAAGAGISPPFGECRDRGMATGRSPLIRQVTALGSCRPSAYAHHHRFHSHPSSAHRNRRTAPRECRNARRRETPQGGPGLVGPRVLMRELCYS